MKRERMEDAISRATSLEAGAGVDVGDGARRPQGGEFRRFDCAEERNSRGEGMGRAPQGITNV